MSRVSQLVALREILTRGSKNRVDIAALEGDVKRAIGQQVAASSGKAGVAQAAAFAAGHSDNFRQTLRVDGVSVQYGKGGSLELVVRPKLFPGLAGLAAASSIYQKLEMQKVEGEKRVYSRSFDSATALIEAVNSVITKEEVNKIDPKDHLTPKQGKQAGHER